MMSNQNIELHYEDGNETVNEIIKILSDIIVCSKNFHDKILNTYDKVELAFLKRLINEISLLEHDAVLIKENFTKIESSLKKVNF